jgi:dTDP-4-dehydrorhamnose reductase
LKTLILGASGQLGQCIAKLVEERFLLDFIFADRLEADILDLTSLRGLFEMHKPDYVINCAAYTAVDQAEVEPELCRAVNKVGASNIAQICVEHDATIIHISTDFVFEGSWPELLNETDSTKPVNVYGLTKLEGEQEILRLCSRYYILRTSWLYSEYGNNFVKTMLRLGRERKNLKVVVDQIGTPTYAMDLAEAILSIIFSKAESYGIYHYSNEGVASWYDFARAIFEFSGSTVDVYPILSSAYPTRAVRPKFSVMDKSKVTATFNLFIPYWRDSLSKCLMRLEHVESF